MRTRVLTSEYLQDLSGFVDLDVVTHFELGLDTTTVERCDDIGRLMPSLSNLRFHPSVSDQLLPPVAFQGDDDEEDENNEEGTLSSVGTVYTNIPRLVSLGTKLTNLKVLWISQCQVKDLRGIQFSPHLQELYASFNQISNLDPIGALQRTLEVCDLEGNSIDDIDSILHNFGNSYENVSGAMSSLLSKRLARGGDGGGGGGSNSSPLRTLTVSGNPFALQDGEEGTASSYRVEILRHLPHLQLLDDTDVRPEELSMALCLSGDTGGSGVGAVPSKKAVAGARHFDPLDGNNGNDEASLLYSSLQRNMHDPLKSMLGTQHRELRSRQTASSAVGGSRAGAAPRAALPTKAPPVEPSSSLTQSRAVFRGGVVRSLREAASSQPNTPPAVEQPTTSAHQQKPPPAISSPPISPMSSEKGFTPSPPRREEKDHARQLNDILGQDLTISDRLANICDDDEEDGDGVCGSSTRSPMKGMPSISAPSTVDNGSKVVRMARPQSALLVEGFREMYRKKGVTLIFHEGEVDQQDGGGSPLPFRPSGDNDEDLDMLLDEVDNGPSTTPKAVRTSSSSAYYHEDDNSLVAHRISSADVLVEMQREKARTAKVVLESALFDAHPSSVVVGGVSVTGTMMPEGSSPRRFRSPTSEETSPSKAPTAAVGGYESLSLEDDDGGATFDDVM